MGVPLALSQTTRHSRGWVIPENGGQLKAQASTGQAELEIAGNHSIRVAVVRQANRVKGANREVPRYKLAALGPTTK